MTHRRRLDLIEKHLREHRYADLHSLASKFSISISTVRRSLDDLEAKGVCRRHHGGASVVDPDEIAREYDFISHDQTYAEEKFSIARFIADQIVPGMTVMIDGGTSAYAVARLLVGKRLRVITNSLPVAGLLSDVSTIETIVTGGSIYNRVGVLTGPHCEETIDRVSADIAVLGASGITERGIWIHSDQLAEVQRRMVAASTRSVFAVDHSKFGRKAPFLATAFLASNTIVSDREPPPEIGAAMRSAGVTLALCPAAL